MQSSPEPKGIIAPGTSTSQAEAFDGESLLHAFEEAWQTGSAPSFAAFVQRLPDGGAARSFVEELVKVDLEYRWRCSPSLATDDPFARPLLEDYVRRYPVLGSLETLSLELIGEEYRVRRLWGDRPDVEAYRGRFPERMEALASLCARIDAELSERHSDTTMRTMPGSGYSARFVPAGYEILCELGRGGMGVVYQARQLRLNRLVAVKTIGSGQGAYVEELARFRAEAEAAARIQHANIVQVHEVGDQDGQPFCILEYVNGGSLSRKLAGAPLEAHVAARLLETLAHAMQAVHDQGTLHRDLKPANVLLHLAHPQDADKPLAELLRSPDCVPKIADFGLARRIESSELTRTGAVLGTPSYMAPEQAEARSDLIGPATDVYGLGAILYELLTGRPPFRGVNVLDTLAQVRSRDPVPPRHLQPSVPREVETICLKCLQKDPGKRYASAVELADDLERFRLHQPISARPASRWERMRKWARRHPALATLAAAVFLGLLVIFMGGTTYTLRLRAARAETERQRQQTAHHYRKALEAVEQMLVRMGAQRLDAIPGTEKAQVEALKEAIRLYRELQREQESPDVDLYVRRAFALTYLGNRQMALGRTEEAEKNCREGLDLLDQLPAELRETADCQQQAAFVRFCLGNILVAKHQKKEAEKWYREACALLAVRADDAKAITLLSACYTGLGSLGGDSSEENYRQALELREKVYNSEPDNLYYRYCLAEGLYNIAHSRLFGAHPQEAEPFFQRCRDLLEPPAAPDSAAKDEPSYRALSQIALEHCYIGLAKLWSDRGEFVQAETFFHKAIAVSERLLQFYPSPGHRQELAQCYLNLGAMYQTNQQKKQAVEVYRKGIAHLETLVREQPEIALYRLTLAQSCANLSLIADNSQHDEALTVLQKGREALEPLVREHPEDVHFAFNYGNLCHNQALVLLYRNRGRDALPWHDRAVAVMEAASRRNPHDEECRNGYALFLAGRGDTRRILHEHHNALADLNRALELNRSSSNVHLMLFRRAEVRIAVGEVDGAGDDIERMLLRPDGNADHRYNCACLFSRATEAIRKQERMAAEERRRGEDKYAARALEILTQLRNDGYFRDADKLRQFESDDDFAPLRQRDDFKRWNEKR